MCEYDGTVGWGNGPPSWAEMERVLNSKPRRSGMSLGEPHADGGDSPAWSRKRGPYEPTGEHPLRSTESNGERLTRSTVPYAELHAHSAYSFLDGASTPEELVEEAVRLDLRAIALTDHDGFYGVVRFAEAANQVRGAAGEHQVDGAKVAIGMAYGANNQYFSTWAVGSSLHPFD